MTAPPSPNGHRPNRARVHVFSCPACHSTRTSWSGRWRTCELCGCSWRYQRRLERALLEVA